MTSEQMRELRRLAEMWQQYAAPADDRYKRGLDICAEQLAGTLDRFEREGDE